MATSKKAASPKPVKAGSADNKSGQNKQSTSGGSNNIESFTEILEFVFKSYKESLDALKLNLGTFVMLAILPFILSMLALPFLIVAGRSSSTFMTVLSFAVMAVLAIISLVFLPAYTITQLESVRGNKVSFGQVFEKSKPLFLPYLGLILLSALAVMVGFVLLILPGIAISLLLTFSGYYLVDKKLGIINSIKASTKLVIENWQWVAALFILQSVIGVFAYIPLLGWAVALVGFIAYLCVNTIVYLKISK